uniref:UBC core domain-containing protein n=1 Tax=Heterorhabditis bacteriophora TaxID=37862 RepID=A0A1I7WJU8_HETBA
MISVMTMMNQGQNPSSAHRDESFNNYFTNLFKRMKYLITVLHRDRCHIAIWDTLTGKPLRRRLQQLLMSMELAQENLYQLLVVMMFFFFLRYINFHIYIYIYIYMF